MTSQIPALPVEESLNPRSRLQMPLLWLLMMALMTGPIVVIQQNTASAWRDAYLFVAVVIAWGLFSTTYLTRLPGWERRPLSYRSAELVVIGVIIRLYLWLQNGFPTLADWRNILIEPGILLGDLWGPYFLLALFAWAWSNGFAVIFSQLEVSKREENFYKLPVKERQSKLDTPLRLQRTPLLQDFFRRWVFGGIILIVCAASTTVRISEIVETSWFTQLNRLPMPGALLIALLLYFFVGFWLLSYARYTVLYARWMAHGARPQPQMARHWRRRSLLMLGIVGFLAALLPIGSSVPLAWMARLVVWAVAAVVAAILGLLGLFLASVTGNQEAAPSEPFQPPPPPIIPPVPQTDAPAGDVLPPELVGGFTLTLLAVVVIIAVVFLVYGRNYGNAGETAGDLWQRFVLWWRSLWGSVKLRATELREQIEQRTRATDDGGEAKARRRRINVDGLSPREQVRYFYLAAVRRAGEKGVERRQDQTPAEFLQVLQDEWPDSAEETGELTDAFLHARYSRQEVEDAGVIKQTWKRVKSSLKRKKKPTDPA